MQKRIHYKNWNRKLNKHEPYNIFGMLDRKQYNLRLTKPQTWFQKMLDKAKQFNKKFQEDYKEKNK